MFDHHHIEESVEALWKKERSKIEKSLQFEKGKPLFSFLEGPPTANAPPALHHLEARVYKDLVCRYKYMKGFTVPRKGGWDCHGLPVEVQVEKKLDLQSKKDVLKYGIANFNAECKRDVFSFIDAWNKFTEKSAFWLDLKDPYATLDKNYMESVWWSLKELYKKKLLYEAHKVVPYCPRCETALSSHEVALGYEEVSVESITVKFRIKDKEQYFLAWTTTPWTLPSNIGLMVNPDITYVYIKESGVEYILAENRASHYFEKPHVVKKVKGKALEGIVYEPLMNYFVGKLKDPAWKVALSKEVTDTDGTGIVHSAPAFGEVDYEVAKKYKMAFIQPVNKDGTFSEDVKDYAGKFVLDADKDIIKNLKEQGKILKVETYKHDYPFCWRCKSPLLYYALISWFIATSKFRKQLVANNKKINWFPEHIREGRFGNWLAEVKDWALSRSKFWGTPIPIWRCPKCKSEECIGSIAELEKRSKKKINDIHKPHVDEIKLKCKCGGSMERVPFVIDCWYDSGAAQFAQFHYPFENKKEFEQRFPYDFIAEAIDQTRGWFYTLHALSTLLFNKPAYRNVVCAGHLVDEKGEKMSKSKGNTINPWELFEKYGVDAIRLLMCTSAPGNTKRVGLRNAEEGVVPYLNILWNTTVFTKEFVKLNSKAKLRLEDEWLVSRANSLVEDAESAIEAHEYQKAFDALKDFVMNDLSRWYIKLVKDRDDEGVGYALAYAFRTISKVSAPLSPYIADYIWIDLLREKGSVHFSGWPKKGKADKELEEQMKIAMNVVETVNAMRQENKIKLKYVLPSANIIGSENTVKAVKSLKDIISKMANVKALQTSAVMISYIAKPNWPVAGKKFGSEIKDIARLLENADATKLKAEIDKKGKAKLGSATLGRDDVIFSQKTSMEAGKEFDGGRIILDMNITEELKEEWLVRELIRAVQDERKKMGLKMKDRATLYVPQDLFKKWIKSIEVSTNTKMVIGPVRGSKREFEFEERVYEFGIHI